MNPVQEAVRKRVDELREAMRGWLKGALNPGVPVVDEYQADPAPAYPYVSFGFVGSLVKLGRADAVTPDGNGGFALRAHRQATITIHAHGKPYQGRYQGIARASDILSGVQMCIDDPVSYGQLSSRNFAILGDNGVLDTTTFEENLWHPRASLDLIIGLSIKASVNPGWIDRTEVQGTVTTDSESEIEFGPFTILRNQGG